MKKILYLIFALIVIPLVSCTDSHTHEYGEWIETEKATCETVGKETRNCSCGEVEERVIEAVGHKYGEWLEIVTATTISEGLWSMECANDCGTVITKKKLVIPVLSLSDNKLVWEPVNGANGYRLYNGNELLAELTSLSYSFEAKELIYNFTLAAYTTDSNYFEESDKSEVLTVTVGFGENLQSIKGTDFEGFNQGVSLSNTWAADFANYSDSTVLVLNDGTNSFGKLLPTTNGGSSIITHSANTAILEAGTYIFSMDIKLGSAVDGTLSFGIWDDVAWFPGWPKVIIDSSSANQDEWTTITYEFTRIEDSTGVFANVDIEYTCVVSDENNYVLIDNIMFINKETSENVNTGNNNTFELFFQPLDTLLSTSGWKLGLAGDTIYVGYDLENCLIVIDDNTVFKAYTSSENSSIDFAGNIAIGQAGLYKMSIKVMLGEDATNVDNIGFRFYSDVNLGTGDFVFEGLDKLSSEEWVTLELYFNIAETSRPSYININFWFFTHNDEIESLNNYILLDDVAVYRLTAAAK